MYKSIKVVTACKILIICLQFLHTDIQWQQTKWLCVTILMLTCHLRLSVSRDISALCVSVCLCHYVLKPTPNSSVASARQL